MGIDILRKQIDAIDEQLLELCNERARLAQQIGIEKQRLGLPIYVPEREQQILDRLQQINPGPLKASAIREIFTCIIQSCRNLETAK